MGYSGQSSAFGIANIFAGGTTQNNVVSTVTATTGYGISAMGGFAHGNTISGATYGVYGGKYQDNLTLNCTTPFYAGTDAGGNN